MKVETLLISGHFIFIVISLFLLINRYKKDPIKVTLNYFSYIIIFSLLYIALPSIFTLVTSSSPVNGSDYAITHSAAVGLYFNFIFLLSFILLKTKDNYTQPIYTIKQLDIKHAVVLVCSLMSIYIFIIFMLHGNYLINIYGNRRLQADFMHQLINVFKVYFLLRILFIFVSYLYLTTKNGKYLFFLLPAVFIDLTLSGRELLSSSLLLLIILNAIYERKFKTKIILIAAVLLIILGLIRSGGSLTNDNLPFAINEFLFTWSTTHLIIDNKASVAIMPTIIYSILKIFPPGLYNLLFGEYIPYTEITSRLNPFPTAGLAGSVVAEALSFKNWVMIILMPNIIVIYGKIMNAFIKRNSIYLKITFVISILFIHPIFRLSLFENLLYPFYLMIFYGFWIYIVDNKQKSSFK